MRLSCRATGILVLASCTWTLLHASPDAYCATSAPSLGAENELVSDAAYMLLPELTQQERLRLGLEASKNRKKYLAEANEKIRAFSTKLERQIRLWMAGNAKAEFPEGFLPPYVDNRKTHHWRLVKTDEIDPQEQWFAMRAYDPSRELHQFSPDPHTTYLKSIFLAPLGSKLLIEGDFPHARFMDVQILSPVDPEHPVTGQLGICEVPIVDVDIQPDPGHVNPFRVGSDRSAKKRHYHLTFDLLAGNAETLNPKAMAAPQYRAPGNTRAGGPFAFTGPFGGNVLVPSVVWIRYYAPDKEAGALGGVGLPKATLQLSTGEKFWITCDKSLVVKLQTDPVPVTHTPPLEPYPFMGPSLGWFKMFGIMRAHAAARAYYKSEPWGSGDLSAARERIRQFFRLVFNQGEDATPPGNHPNAATECNYIAYLVRPMSLGEGKVVALTGKLPRFPRTRDGEKVMEGGELRYFSITHQLGGNGPYNKGYYATPYGSLMDDEIVVNNEREYVIVYSRGKDRPRNARAEYGVTWQEWGPPATQGFVLRWLSVMPEWYLERYSFHDVSWQKADFAQDTYDVQLFGRNRQGHMGPYHPVIHYMDRGVFEAMGERPIAPEDVPEWKEKPTAKVQETPGTDANVRDKAQALKQAFDDLREARQAGNAKEARAAALKIRRIWDELPDGVHQRIEQIHPGITQKIDAIPSR